MSDSATYREVSKKMPSTSVDVTADTTLKRKSARRQRPHRKHFYTWTATDSKQIVRSEQMIMRGLHYYQANIQGLHTLSSEDIHHLDDHYGNPQSTSVKRGYVSLDPFDDLVSTDTADSDSYLNQEGSCAAMDSDDREILVMVHGFAGGSAMWAQNWEFFCERYRVFAIDLPGFALSVRRSFSADTLEGSMDYFCGYLQRWMFAMNFTKPVIFLGHSFGAFVCSHYAMRVGPSQVRALILADPWGVNPGNPEALKAASLTVRVLRQLFFKVNPLALLRALGPAGPAVMESVRSDIKRQWEGYLDDPALMTDYIYHCNVHRPVGESLFKVCCHMDIAAKVPLSEVLPSGLHSDIPLGIIFAGKSWINPTVALSMADEMRTMGFQVLTDNVEDAGHLLFTDQPRSFNQQTHGMIQSLLFSGHAMCSSEEEL